MLTYWFIKWNHPSLPLCKIGLTRCYLWRTSCFSTEEWESAELLMLDSLRLNFGVVVTSFMSESEHEQIIIVNIFEKSVCSWLFGDLVNYIRLTLLVPTVIRLIVQHWNLFLLHRMFDLYSLLFTRVCTHCLYSGLIVGTCITVYNSLCLANVIYTRIKVVATITYVVF